MAKLRSGAPWSSQQPVGTDALLRQVGFEPAGVVLGDIYSYTVPLRRPPGYRPKSGMGFAPGRNGLWDDPMSARNSGGYVHDWSVTSKGESRMDMGWTWERIVRQGRERDIARLAISRLVLETRSLGAHGVIGIEFAIRQFGFDAQRFPVFEMSVQGTAVRVPGLPPIETPFTTGLDAAEVMKLISNGYAPVAFTVGIGIVCGQLGATSRRRLRSMNNGEVEQFSEVTQQSFMIARRDLERGTSSDKTVVLAEAPLFDVHREVGGTYDATVRIPGSKVRKFQHRIERPTLDFMPVVSLNDRA